MTSIRLTFEAMEIWERLGQYAANLQKKRGGVVREGLPKDPNMGSKATLAWGLEG